MANADYPGEQSILSKAERLLVILTHHATGGSGPGDEDEYQRLRRELLSSPIAKSHVPRFVATCRNMGQFWDYIQPKYAHYRERRTFLLSEFQPLLSSVEQFNTFPVDEAAGEQIHRYG
ncbi:MAG: hypothetical protein ABSE73_20075 [Planctomycetota bacterium]